MSALLGTFVSLKTMADGGVRITLDMQCTLADMAPMGLIPGVPFGIARITGESTIDHHHETRMDATYGPNSEPKTRGLPTTQKTRAGELCIMACTFCKDPQFRKWAASHHGIQCVSEQDAKDIILRVCEIDSRKELDTDSNAADWFHSYFRLPFMEWKAAQ